MPEYVIEREVPGAGNLTEDEIREVSLRSLAVLKDLGSSIQWLHSYVTDEKIYCVYFARDEEKIREHARRQPLARTLRGLKPGGDIMNILLFGATGMVGDGVLRWLIASAQVDRVVAVSRKALSVQHAKLQTVIESDIFRLQNLDALHGFDACFFCLGASSVGMSPEAYRRLTYDLTLAVARQLLPGNPRMVFEYISGEGTDANSRQKWARVKAETEAAMFGIGFRDAYALRPGFIQPMRGATSRMRSVRSMYALTTPIYPSLQKRFGRFVTSTDRLAAAMLQLAIAGSPKKILNTRELNAVADSGVHMAA